MILHDVMKQLTLTDLESILACLYERGIQVDSCKKLGHATVLGLYMDFVKRLCALTPSPQPAGEEMVLLGYPRKWDPENEDDQPRAYVDVSLYEQAQLRELDPKAIGPNAFLVGPDLADEQVAARLAALREEPGDWGTFAYEMTPWEETLGFEVSWDNICRCGLHAFMADVLGEMSYYGVDREDQDEQRETVAERYAEIARAFETGKLPDLEGEESEEPRRAPHEDDPPENDEAEENGGNAPEDLGELMAQLSELARMEGASRVVMPTELLSAFAPKGDADGAEDDGAEKQWLTLEEMAAKHGIDLEELERKRREKETPAFLIAKTRVALWNAAQERRALLHWLGASPAIAEMREDEAD